MNIICPKLKSKHVTDSKWYSKFIKGEQTYMWKST